MGESFLIAMYVSHLTLIAVFLYRLKFIRTSSIVYVGMAFIVELLLPLMGLLAAVLIKLPVNETVFLFDNIVVFFTFALFLLAYSKQQIVPQHIAWVTFVVFGIIWAGELGINLFKNGVVGMQRLRVAPVFLCGIVISGVLFYWFKVLRKNEFFYLKNPFFWVTLGWFIYFVLDVPTHFPSIAHKPFFEKIVLFGYLSVYTLMSHVCHIVAFWKTRNWMLKGYAQK